LERACGRALDFDGEDRLETAPRLLESQREATRPGEQVDGPQHIERHACNLAPYAPGGAVSELCLRRLLRPHECSGRCVANARPGPTPRRRCAVSCTNAACATG